MLWQQPVGLHSQTSRYCLLSHLSCHACCSSLTRNNIINFKLTQLFCSSRDRMKRVKVEENDSGGPSSNGPAKTRKKAWQQLREEEDVFICDWTRLPQEMLLHIFQYLPLLDRAFASQVCRDWNHAFHMPELWRCFEFELNQPASSYLKATHPDLIKQIMKRHSNHLQYVSFKVREMGNYTHTHTHTYGGLKI